MDLNELMAQRDALTAQINAELAKERTAALETIRALVAKFEFSVDDFAPKKAKRGVAPGTKVTQKYKNPQTGETWSGRGKPPAWIASSENRSEFLNEV